VPVIIYTGSAHAKELVSTPVVADTNDPQRVFTIVVDIAKKKFAESMKATGTSPSATSKNPL
jgi:hypothetical protein